MILAKPESIVKNDNGIAYKFAGGLMICARDAATALDSVTVKFAEKFVELPYICVTNRYSYSNAIVWSVGVSDTSGVTLYAFNIRGVPVSAYSAYVVAIGRWK